MVYFKKSFIRYLAYFLVGFLFSLFFSLRVHAVVAENVDVSPIYINGTKVYDTSASLNTYKMVSSGSSTNIRYTIDILSNLPVSESYFLTTQVCSNYGWEGLTDSSNVTSSQGKITYVSMPYFNTAGSCTVNGYTGTIVQNIYVVNIIPSASVSGSSWVFFGSLTAWHGGYAQYNGFIQVLSASLTPYSPELEAQLQNAQSQSIIINQNGEIINQSVQTNEKLDDINSSINDDNVSQANSQATDFFEDFTTDTHGLTGIITAPLTAIASLTSSTCTPLVLPLPFVDSSLTLPCMRQIYDDNFGAFMTIYDIIVIGIISYWIIVRIFTLVKDFKNPEHDEVEVMEL